MHPNKNKPEKKARALFVWGGEMLAMALAVVSTVFIVGPFYGSTVDFVRGYVGREYGYNFEGVAAFFWFIISAVISFGFVSLFFILIIHLVGLKFSSRR